MWLKKFNIKMYNGREQVLNVFVLVNDVVALAFCSKRFKHWSFIFINVQL